VSRQAAERGGLAFQHCKDCGAVIYPPRELCPGCLSDNLEWQPSEGVGEALATSVLMHSFFPAFGRDARLPLVSVRLDEGPVVIAFAADEEQKAGAPVKLTVDAARPLGPAIVAVAKSGDAPA